ncbi:MAG: aldehyde ferredoxin oxidoreductase family protein [Proteobacteria bacterium]|nr:aldehyde ferredoxin oxidoreductase family protein [Pseudomonadota bacterium]MBU1582255.1 aldehyde ferredoxin oxidoreductase family protein [Pseudomonadota bacterium]MBU2452433.1 aldehyde ferredoxin oxidoreductase family protein [Pseudomonadota bacterium]MBU2632027.1 aldehyde ferredoxin oxidoreductase family protein [Pseudomonadota bacterium]
MYGFYNQILTIDLTHETVKIDPLEDEVLKSCLGGKGLATFLLNKNNPTGVDPLSPENHLIFATGQFCQSPIWGSSRYGVYTKSPLTGGYAESYSGGKVPEAIDSCGFDAILITGRAKHPVVIGIHPEGATIFPADHLWGKETYDTEEQVITEFALESKAYHKPGVVVIGPAGEKQVAFALIANDKWRCAGRAGAGAVMGSKHLKAVVFQGDRKREMFQGESLKAYCRTFSKDHAAHPAVKAYKSMGTTMMVSLMNSVGAFPSRYWSQGTCDHWESINGETFHKEHDVTPHACAKCFMACGRMATISKGPHKGLKIEGPEYETIYAFGGICMVTDIAEIAFLNDLCDRLGLDTITTGNLCGFAMEAELRGIIHEGIQYKNTDSIADLIKKIAQRSGIGDLLARGIIPTAKAWGLEDLAIHVKGMEPAGYDPRVLKGMGLTFGTSPRGACHLRTTFYKPELAGIIPPDTIIGKADLLVDYEDRLNIFDTGVLCRFYRDFYPWEELEKLMFWVTGLKLNQKSLRKTAAAITDTTRSFNLREGLTPEQDRLPKRLHTEALPSGKAITTDEMELMLKDYYAARGWDKKGFPCVSA